MIVKLFAAAAAAGLLVAITGVAADADTQWGKHAAHHHVLKDTQWGKTSDTQWG